MEPEMQPFSTLHAMACPLGLANVDTDQLIPARFMIRPRSAGYGQFLLHDGRGTTAAVLTESRYAGAAIFVARRNFGVGSSRESAVYALWDFGIRCVIAPSFGDIFASNAAKNGLLTAVVSEAEVEALLAGLSGSGDPTLTVDLDATTITGAGQNLRFTIDPVRRLQLLNGWDDIDLTMRHKPAIVAFAHARAKELPWTIPAPHSR
jgi:3-isopropylmalate/(R)-2-methylmalate dehydratase small subunit